MERYFVIWPYFLFFLLICGLFGLLLAPWRPASAQTETVLAVMPGETLLFLNGSTSAQVQLYVSNVQDLNAFDITLTYDGTLVSITDYGYDGFLSNATCLREVNTEGYFRLACFQFYTGVSGSGPLVDLTFEAVNGGSTPVVIESAVLSALGGQPIPHQVQQGKITVCCHTDPVTGAIFLQGRAGRGGLPVSLGTGARFGQGPYTTFSTPTLGFNLDFGLVAHDTYTLTTAQPGYLNPAQAVTVSDPLSLPPLRLLAGDVTGDGAVGTPDLDAIRAAFGQMGTDLPADLNGDGLVDLRDLALAGGNFGLSASDAYADWLE